VNKQHISMRNLCVVVGVVLGLCAQAGATVLTITANNDNARDAFVWEKYEDGAFDYRAGSRHTNAVIEADGADRGRPIHGLLMFEDLIGSGANQITPDSQIDSATLTLWYVNDNKNADVNLYPMLVTWDEDSTWNSLGGGVLPGVNAGTEGMATGNFGRRDPVSVTVNITDAVQLWADGQENPRLGVREHQHQRHTIRFQ